MKKLLLILGIVGIVAAVVVIRRKSAESDLDAGGPDPFEVPAN